MRKAILGAAMLLSSLLPGAFAQSAQAASQSKASWYSCRLTVRGEQIESRTCRTYAMPKAPRQPLGWWIRRSRIDALHVRSVRYPTFEDSKPVAKAVRNMTAIVTSGLPGWRLLGYFPVTGYSYTAACGDVNGITASGAVPSVGTIANDWLPFGTVVSIPSVGYTGTVLDRGQGEGGFDLFMPSCSATYSVTGYRAVYTR